MKQEAINMVSCQHFLSGIGQYGYHLSKELQNNGANVHLFKPAKRGHLDQEIDRLDWVTPVPYRSLGNLHPYILPIFLSKKLVFRNTEGINHAHWFLSGLALSYLKKKFVVTMHDVSLLHVKEKAGYYTQYYSWAIKRFIKLGVPIITVSENARQDAITYGKIPESQVFTVYNGVDFERFNTNQTAMPKDASTFTIVYAGGLGPRKNLKLLLDAYTLLEKKYPFLQLKIAGAFPERTPYPAYAESLKIKNITFTGYLPDSEMPNFYKQGDIMVFPSTYEGFGFAPLEAMACGVPVLSAKGGSLKEISGGGAQLFEYDKEDLKSQITALIDNREALESLKEKGSKWVNKYTWQQTAAETRKIYKLIA